MEGNGYSKMFGMECCFCSLEVMGRTYTVLDLIYFHNAFCLHNLDPGVTHVFKPVARDSND